MNSPPDNQQGNLDGLGAEMSAAASAAHRAIAESPYAETSGATREILRDLRLRRGRWSSLAEFDPLLDLARRVLEDGWLLFSRLPDGRAWVDVPFRPGNVS